MEQILETIKTKISLTNSLLAMLIAVISSAALQHFELSGFAWLVAMIGSLYGTTITIAFAVLLIVNSIIRILRIVSTYAQFTPEDLRLAALNRVYDEVNKNNNTTDK